MDSKWKLLATLGLVLGLGWGTGEVVQGVEAMASTTTTLVSECPYEECAEDAHGAYCTASSNETSCHLDPTDPLGVSCETRACGTPCQPGDPDCTVD